jgi:gas vesicle protein
MLSLTIKKQFTMSTGKVVLGTLAGLAIGAIAGILFAPDKGSATRKQIMDKGDDYVGKLKSKFDEFCQLLTDKVDSTKKEAEDMVQRGKAKMDDARKEVRNVATDISHGV